MVKKKPQYSHALCQFAYTIHCPPKRRVSQMQNNLLSLKINSQSKQTILGLLSLALVLLVGCTNVPMKEGLQRL